MLHFIFNCLKRKKMYFVGWGGTNPYPGQIVFVTELLGGYAVYYRRFAKKWVSILPKNLFKEVK